MELVQTPSLVIEQYRDRQEWLEARRTFVGASESAALCGEGYAGQSAGTVWLDKVGCLGSADFATLQMRLGANCEVGVLATAVTEFGLEATHNRWGVIRHPEIPCIACTPDAITDGEEPVEVKVLSNRTCGPLRDGVVPLIYQIQLQHQMLCCRADRGLLIANLANEDLYYGWVYANKDFQAMLTTYIREFWALVESQIQPIWHDAMEHREALQRLYAKSNAEYVLLSQHADRMITRRERAAELMKKIEAVKAAAENEIKEELMHAEYGVTPDGRIVSWKTIEKNGYWVRPSKSRVFKMLVKLPAHVCQAKGEVSDVERIESDAGAGGKGLGYDPAVSAAGVHVHAGGRDAGDHPDSADRQDTLHAPDQKGEGPRAD